MDFNAIICASYSMGTEETYQEKNYYAWVMEGHPASARPADYVTTNFLELVSAGKWVITQSFM